MKFAETYKDSKLIYRVRARRESREREGIGGKHFTKFSEFKSDLPKLIVLPVM